MCQAGGKRYYLDTAQDHGNNFFSANVHQCDMPYSVVHVQCFLFTIMFPSLRPYSIKRCFVLPAGL